MYHGFNVLIAQVGGDFHTINEGFVGTADEFHIGRDNIFT